MEAYTPLQWLLIFFVYSVLGWVWESCYVSVKSKRWVNRGFLHGPWLPIYGSGAVVVLVVTLPARGRPALIFLLGMIGATVLEYVTGESMEKLFHMRYWDYSDKPLNVNGHICLGVSIGWGVFSLVLLYVLHPPVEDLVLWLPVPVAQVLALCLTAAFAVDTTWSVQKALDTGDIRLLKTDFTIPARSVDMCTLRDVTPTAAASAFMEMVRQDAR